MGILKEACAMKSQMGTRGMATRFGVAAVVLAWSGAAWARPGTHGPSVATWDARASSAMVSLRPGFMSGGHFFIGSYNANFSNTTGNLSAQFGFHYLNFRGPGEDTTAHGVSGTAVAMFSMPVMPRYENGVPKVAVGMFLGSAPSALISGELNYLTIPVVLGVGVPMSPHKMVTIVPWLELSPAFNLDTVIRPAEFKVPNPADYCDSYPTPANPNAPISCPRLTQQMATDYVSSAVSLDTSFKVGARLGLDFNFHITDGFSVNLGGMVGSLGSAFKGTTVGWLGGALVWHWDDIVPAVLPPDKRLLNESCEDVERRFYTCPQADKCPLSKQTQPPATPPGQSTDQQMPGTAPMMTPPASMSPAPGPLPAPAPSPTYPPAPAPAPTYTPTPAPSPYGPPPMPAPSTPYMPPPPPAPIPAPSPPPAYPLAPR
jgi:hypothetical protein